MRMWGISPELLCRRHLLGEHLEMHMFAGAIKKGKSLEGYLNKGLVETARIVLRHNDLAREMRKRGYRHCSPMPRFRVAKLGQIDVNSNTEELARRCVECRSRMTHQKCIQS